MVTRTFGLIGLAAILTVLWVMNCSGPQPSVSNVRLIEPSNQGAPYRIESLIQNEGRGHGQVAVKFRLRDRTTEQTIQEDRKAVLEPGETARVSAEIQAPPGDYAPEVEAEYPPR